MTLGVYNWKLELWHGLDRMKFLGGSAIHRDRVYCGACGLRVYGVGSLVVRGWAWENLCECESDWRGRIVYCPEGYLWIRNGCEL